MSQKIKVAIFFDDESLTASDEYAVIPRRFVVGFSEEKLVQAREVLKDNPFLNSVQIQPLETLASSEFDITLQEELITVNSYGNVFSCFGKYCGTHYDKYLSQPFLIDSELVDDSMVLPDVIVLNNGSNELKIYLDDINLDVSESVQTILDKFQGRTNGKDLIEFLNELVSLSNKKGTKLSVVESGVSFEFEGKIYGWNDESLEANVLKFVQVQ